MKAEMLLGGKTRFTVLGALADAKAPLTAYQIAIAKGLDPAATYRTLAEFSEFGIAKSQVKRNQRYYSLSGGPGRAAVNFLRSLEEKKPRSDDIEEWLSPRMRSERLSKLVRLERSRFRDGKVQDIGKIMSRRVRGELSALIISSKIAFDELFEKKNGVFVLKE